MPGGMLEQNRRPTRAQHPVANLGHFQMGTDRNANALQLAELLQLVDKIA
jgi:hypothetical protein